MSKRVTLNDGVDHLHHQLRLVESSKLAGAATDETSGDEVESRCHNIDGSLASSTAEQWRKKGSGKLQTRQPSVQSIEVEAVEVESGGGGGADREQQQPASSVMVEQLESSVPETKKRGFEQVCILSRNPNDEAEFGFQDELADEATEDEEESYEKVALGIGMLQARVAALRGQLRDSMFQRNAGRHAKSVAVRFRTTAGVQPPSSASAAKFYTRRKASDYDINNVVMPVSVGANYVEHIRHERIETPKWRLVEDDDDAAAAAAAAHVAEPSSSSENENTDDETYHRRHAELEAREKKNRIPEKKPATEGQKSKSKLKPKGSTPKPKSKAGRPRKHKLPPPPLDSDQQQLNN